MKKYLLRPHPREESRKLASNLSQPYLRIVAYNCSILLNIDQLMCICALVASWYNSGYYVS